MGIPGEAEPFRLVTNQLDLSIHLAKSGWLKRVLGAVKDEDLAIDTKRGDDIWVLRLIPSLVHLARVLNLLDNVALDGSNVAGISIAPNLASLLIVIGWVWRDSFGNLNIGNLQEICALVGRMRAKEQAVHAVVLALWFLDVGEPLDSQSWPRQGRPSTQLDHVYLSQISCSL